MTTLTAAPLARLIDRLLREADAVEEQMYPIMADTSDEERMRLMRSKTSYREI